MIGSNGDVNVEERREGFTIAKNTKKTAQDPNIKTYQTTVCRAEMVSNLNNKIGDEVCFPVSIQSGKRGVHCGGLVSEAPPLRSVSGRGGRLHRCSHHCDGPVSPETTSCSNATQLTCDCLFSLKKCQSVRSQVCCSSSCFCCFLPPTLSVFPCRLQQDQSDAAGRI